MGLFDMFKKKDCEICGKEVGMFGYKKLEDGEICKDCVKLLSPWFEDRRHATVAQIKDQLVYREENARELEHFVISRTIGEACKMYIEEVNDVPTRFFVTSRADYKEENPDIISFKDVISCVTDVEVRDEEIKQKNAEGEMVSCRPPRYKHYHDFYIKMEIRNNPYFDDIKFRINGSTITLETVGDIGGGFGGAALSGLLQGVGVSTAGVQTHSYRNSSENRRYEECRMICEKIQQAVEDGKRGTPARAGTGSQDPLLEMIAQIRNAADRETVENLCRAAVAMNALAPRAEISQQISQAMADASVRLDHEEAGIPYTPRAQAAAPAAAPAEPKPVRDRSCSGCGAPYDGGKFCQNCGTPWEEPQKADTWTCFCGSENTGKFCQNCGIEQFAPDWIECSECSWTSEDGVSVPKFCPNCGKQFNGDDIN